MISKGFRRKSRCSTMLSAAVLCATVSVAYGGTVILQTPAEDRLFDKLAGALGWGSDPAPSSGSHRPYNIPDVAGFGMYPLWKFHKFDGLSLRPVPYGVDVGKGLPPVPQSPSYPAGFPGISSAAPPPSYPPVAAAHPPAYTPPSSYDAPSYSEAAPAYSAPAQYAQQSSYSAPPPSSSYESAPPQTLSYVPSGYGQGAPQSNNYGGAPPSNNYGGAPSYGGQSINIGYQPQPYEAGPPSYNGPSAGGYGEPAYAPSYGGQMGAPGQGYDAMPYGSNGITFNFGAAPQQDYGMMPNYQPAGSFQMPNYASIESPLAAAYPPPDMKPMQMEPGFGGGGFQKRHLSFEAEKDDSKNQSGESDKTAILGQS